MRDQHASPTSAATAYGVISYKYIMNRLKTPIHNSSQLLRLPPLLARSELRGKAKCTAVITTNRGPRVPSAEPTTQDQHNTRHSAGL